MQQVYIPFCTIQTSFIIKYVIMHAHWLTTHWPQAGHGLHRPPSEWPGCTVIPPYTGTRRQEHCQGRLSTILLIVAQAPLLTRCLLIKGSIAHAHQPRLRKGVGGAGASCLDHVSLVPRPRPKRREKGLGQRRLVTIFAECAFYYRASYTMNCFC